MVVDEIDEPLGVMTRKYTTNAPATTMMAMMMMVNMLDNALLVPSAGSLVSSDAIKYANSVFRNARGLFIRSNVRLSSIFKPDLLSN